MWEIEKFLPLRCWGKNFQNLRNSLNSGRYWSIVLDEEKINISRALDNCKIRNRHRRALIGRCRTIWLGVFLCKQRLPKVRAPLAMYSGKIARQTIVQQRQFRSFSDTCKNAKIKFWNYSNGRDEVKRKISFRNQRIVIITFDIYALVRTHSAAFVCVIFQIISQFLDVTMVAQLWSGISIDGDDAKMKSFWWGILGSYSVHFFESFRWDGWNKDRGIENCWIFIFPSSSLMEMPFQSCATIVTYRNWKVVWKLCTNNKEG